MPPPEPIPTPRLLLVPFTGELAHLALHDRPRFARLLHAEVPDVWPNVEFAEVLGVLAPFHRKEPDRARWSRLIVWRSPRTLIGEVGAIDPPVNDGIVEIGYGVIPPWRGRGAATEAVAAFCTWIAAQPRIVEIRADTQVHNVASARVLVHAGFTTAGQRQDATDGELLEWTRRVR